MIWWILESCARTRRPRAGGRIPDGPGRPRAGGRIPLPDGPGRPRAGGRIPLADGPGCPRRCEPKCINSS